MSVLAKANKIFDPVTMSDRMSQELAKQIASGNQAAISRLDNKLGDIGEYGPRILGLREQIQRKEETLRIWDEKLEQVKVDAESNIPTDFISSYAGGSVWYAPIVAVIMGIPMYSNAAGILPLVEVLTQKGMLLGTALSFMMAVVALSLPEAMILKRVLSVKLIGIFFGIVGFAILLTGYLFNMILG